VVITMGCGDACPVYPAKRYEDWDVDDATGEPIYDVREIRDENRARVEDLVRLLEAAAQLLNRLSIPHLPAARLARLRRSPTTASASVR
jgi:hypothetical protein